MDETFAVIGAGPVGTGLAQLLVEQGFRVVGVASRRAASAERAAERAGCPWLPDVDTALAAASWVFLTVPDDSLAALADRLTGVPTLEVVAHLSGALESGELRRPGSRYQVVSMHPVASVPDASSAAERLRHCWYGVEGDLEAVARARALIEGWGGQPFPVDPGAKPLYHAGACLAAGYLCTLLAAASDMWRLAGVPEGALAAALPHLSQGTLDNIRRRGPVGALTGPIKRGDRSTVRRHLAALREQESRWTDLYRAMGRATLNLSPHPELETLLKDLDA